MTTSSFFDAMLLSVTFENCETLVPGFFMQIVATRLSYHCSCHHFSRASNAMKFNPLQRRCKGVALPAREKNRTCNWTFRWYYNHMASRRVNCDLSPVAKLRCPCQVWHRRSLFRTKSPLPLPIKIPCTFSEFPFCVQI